MCWLPVGLAFTAAANALAARYSIEYCGSFSSDSSVGLLGFELPQSSPGSTVGPPPLPGGAPPSATPPFTGLRVSAVRGARGRRRQERGGGGDGGGSEGRGKKNGETETDAWMTKDKT